MQNGFRLIVRVVGQDHPVQVVLAHDAAEQCQPGGPEARRAVGRQFGERRLNVATAGSRAWDAEPGSQALHESGVVFARAATRLMVKVNDVQREAGPLA